MKERQPLNTKKLVKTFLCQNWTISRQICCYSCSLIILTFILSLSSSIFMYSYTMNMFTIEYPAILYAQSVKQITHFIKLQEIVAQNFFDDKIFRIANLNNLFKFIQQDNFHIQEPFMCFNEKSLLFNQQLTASVFCGGIGNLSYVAHDAQFYLDFTSLLTEINLIYDLRQPYFTSTTDDSFFGITDFIAKPNAKNLVPIHQRDWYLDHLRLMGSGKSVIESSPFFSGDYIIQFGLTTNLSHINGTLLGIGGQNLDLRLIPNLSKENIQVQMVNEKDQLIVSPLYQVNSTEILYIYNTTLTGISKQQWISMKNRLNTSDLYLSKVTGNSIMAMIRLRNPQSYIILEIDNSENVKQQNQILTTIQANANFIVNCSIFTYLGLGIIILIVQSALLKFFYKDIQKIMEATQLRIYQHYFSRQLKERQFEQENDENIINNLHKAYLKLINNSNNKKNYFCLQIEDIEYPVKDLNYQLINMISLKQLQDKHLKMAYALKHAKELRQWLVKKTNKMFYGVIKQTQLYK